MLSWLQKAEYTPKDLGRKGIKFIHVAGTKGKGSVCAMIERIFVEYQQTDRLHARWKPTLRGSTKNNVSPLCRIGVFSSPHLLSPRERIRINGVNITKTMFNKYFWDIWIRFSRAAERDGDESIDPLSSATKPSYFRFLTILALHCFIQEGVRTAIIECGIGGEYDSTNILPQEAIAVSAIASIGIDHVGMLGNTIEEIARHKAGIMRKGVPAISIKQKPKAQEVLENIASGRETELVVVGKHKIFRRTKIRLGLEGEHQKDNASLAIAVTERYMLDMKLPLGPMMDKPKFPDRFKAGLENVNLPGRCHALQQGNIEWCIDGAHTMESIDATAAWFTKKLRKHARGEEIPVETWLIFNQQLRDPLPLLERLLSTIRMNISSLTTQGQRFNFDVTAIAKNFSITERLQQEDSDDEQWHAIKASGMLDGSKPLHAPIRDIVNGVYKSPAALAGERIMVLVTGSLHTAGRVLLQLNERHLKKVTRAKDRWMNKMAAKQRRKENQKLMRRKSRKGDRGDKGEGEEEGAGDGFGSGPGEGTARY